MIVEYGFLDTKEDAERLKNNYKDYALAVVDAVLDYKGIIPENTEYYIVKKGDTKFMGNDEYVLILDKSTDKSKKIRKFVIKIKSAKIYFKSANIALLILNNIYHKK